MCVCVCVCCVRVFCVCLYGNCVAIAAWRHAVCAKREGCGRGVFVCRPIHI